MTLERSEKFAVGLPESTTSFSAPSQGVHDSIPSRTAGTDIRSVLITGASGFIGSALHRRLKDSGMERIYCLSRRVSVPDHRQSDDPTIHIQADICEPKGYAHILPHVDAVVHLAALTGKASRHEHFRVNADGTRKLVEECSRHALKGFILVSSIAAKFRHTRHYHYARAKQDAEAIVAASGLHYTIVRPTIVLGPGGGPWDSLARLARARVTPMFGPGTARVQPIDVDDVAAFICSHVRTGRFANAIVEVGGPEILTIEELVRRIARAYGRERTWVVHLPAVATQRVLALLELVFLRWLPFTAGQLTAFIEDSTITPGEQFDPHRLHLRTVSQMIQHAASQPEALSSVQAFS